MSEARDDLDPVVDRLKSLGERRIDGGTETRVLARAHAARVSWLGSTKAKVAAAAASGFLLGSVGLASAGTLPAPAQDVAHTALGAVGIDVPPGHDRYNGPECGGTYANHGAFVEAHPDDPEAGRSPCGKPAKAVARSQGKGRAGAGHGAARKGPPPWAKGGKGSKADKGDKGARAEKDDDEKATTPSSTAATTTTPPTTAAVTTTTAPVTTTTSAPSTTTSTAGTTSTSTTSTSTTTTTGPTTTTAP